MENLQRFGEHFDGMYPDYRDREYERIKGLMDVFRRINILQHENFNQFISLILPIISVKNYKSQIPFPENVAELIEALFTLYNADINIGNRFSDENKGIIERLLSFRGFGLPTVSAFLHFSIPTVFPIVDKNVVNALTKLYGENRECFNHLDAPRLPYPNARPPSAISKYQQITCFIDIVKQCQEEEHRIIFDYRSLDKCLMVYGGVNNIA